MGSKLRADHPQQRGQICTPVHKFWSCNEGQIVSDTKKMKGEIVRSLRAKLANFEEQPRSDIIRTISSLSREEMPLGRSSVLYIFSDLIENSDHMATRTLLSVSPKALINNLKKNELVASLDGAEVHAFVSFRQFAKAESTPASGFSKAYDVLEFVL